VAVPHLFFLSDKCCKAAYAKAHKFLTDCCAIITNSGGVARSLTHSDWTSLIPLPKSRPFHSSMLA
jgi:hypothetical protein